MRTQTHRHTYVYVHTHTHTHTHTHAHTHTHTHTHTHKSNNTCRSGKQMASLNCVFKNNTAIQFVHMHTVHTLAVGVHVDTQLKSNAIYTSFCHVR